MLSYGRFYSNDPVGFRDVHSSNHYAYANNNLYKFVDPNGMDAVSIKGGYNLPSAITMLNSFYFVSQDLELRTSYTRRFKWLLNLFIPRIF